MLSTRSDFSLAFSLAISLMTVKTAGFPFVTKYTVNHNSLELTKGKEKKSSCKILKQLINGDATGQTI